MVPEHRIREGGEHRQRLLGGDRLFEQHTARKRNSIAPEIAITAMRPERIIHERLGTCLRFELSKPELHLGQIAVGSGDPFGINR